MITLLAASAALANVGESAIAALALGGWLCIALGLIGVGLDRRCRRERNHEGSTETRPRR